MLTDREESRTRTHVVPPYLAPRDDDAVRAREKDRKAAGAVLTAGSVLGLVFVWILFNLRIHPAPPPAPPPPLEYKVPGTLTGLAAALILGTGLWFRRRHGSSAFLLGSLIGLGIGALIEGLCFAGLFRH